jgi:DNA-binding transcriptional ArsR family regulator
VSNERPARVSSAAIKAGNFDAFVEEVSVPVETSIGSWYSAPIGALMPTLDATFFALSDPTRRGILERLSRGPATLSHLALPSGLTLNGIKKHVGILERAGLVETEKVGRTRECRLGPATTLGEAGEWIEAHRRAWEGRLDRFERFVERAE